MHLKIDHVTIAGSSLAEMDKAFATIGLTTDYGGPHSNGITHMSLLGFDDGSYIELISSLEPGKKDAAFWGEHIVANGGPCAWAVYADDVSAETTRIAALGETVDGPHTYNRRRPDGKLVEWDLAFLGNKGAGATLPFIIKDTTPRSLRVQPSASVAGTPLTGINTVVLAVGNMQTAINLFQRVYNWPSPIITEDSYFGAKLAWFVDTPVVLASLLHGHTWLPNRLVRFGHSPCAYLLGTSNFEAVCRQLKLETTHNWFDRQVAWIDPKKINGTKLGIIG